MTNDGTEYTFLLHFVWHLSFKDFLLTSRYSIVDSSVYICWGLMDFVMIGFVSRNYGDTGLITLAVVVSLIEFGVVLDGAGMAIIEEVIEDEQEKRSSKGRQIHTVLYLCRRY